VAAAEARHVRGPEAPHGEGGGAHAHAAEEGQGLLRIFAPRIMHKAQALGPLIFPRAQLHLAIQDRPEERAHAVESSGLHVWIQLLHDEASCAVHLPTHAL